MKLVGTEEISIELEGALEAPFACAAASPLVFDREVSILVLTMRRLGVQGAPLLPRFDYREVLWRAGATLDGTRVWLALRCDLDRFAIRRLAEATIRYPVVRSEIAIEDDGRALRVESRSERDTFSARLTLGDRIDEVRAPRRTFVVSRGSLYEIPWGERPAPERWDSKVAIEDASALTDIFGGAVTIDSHAVVHRGRTHLCGAARRYRG